MAFTSWYFSTAYKPVAIGKLSYHASRDHSVDLSKGESPEKREEYEMNQPLPQKICQEEWRQASFYEWVG